MESNLKRNRVVVRGVMQCETGSIDANRVKYCLHPASTKPFFAQVLVKRSKESNSRNLESRATLTRRIVERIKRIQRRSCATNGVLASRRIHLFSFSRLARTYFCFEITNPFVFSRDEGKPSKQRKPQKKSPMTEKDLTNGDQ